MYLLFTPVLFILLNKFYTNYSLIENKIENKKIPIKSYLNLAFFSLNRNDFKSFFSDKSFKDYEALFKLLKFFKKYKGFKIVKSQKPIDLDSGQLKILSSPQDIIWPDLKTPLTFGSGLTVGLTCDHFFNNGEGRKKLNKF